MKSEQELRQLAIDIVGGKVFGTWNVKNLDDVRLVFMVVSMLDDKTLKELQEKEVEHFYEYLDKAGPRSINGMPMFFSAQYITKPEMELLQPMIKQYKESKEAFLQEAKP